MNSSEQESFRNRIATVDDAGRRNWIYPKKPSGPLHRARVWVSLFLLSIFFAGPFIRINGQPILLLNVLERKFVIFGLAFWPQDFHIFVLVMIAAIVFIVLFTVVYGRVWCGWACPQTIFMEMVFRKIEYWIEGGARKQKALNGQEWNAEKILKKGSKQIIFYSLSFLIGNLFLAYIIGTEQLFDIITDPPSQHKGGLTAMILFSGMFYFVFSWFREQACVIVCPYGRLQGVFLDRNSIVVSYDNLRGEKRMSVAKAKKNPDAGDCIDCHQCVKVCPTGIDIRNGTQLECVNCTACIDACNSIMIGVNKPKGLIRYASHNSIQTGEKLGITPRIIGYSAVLVLLLSLVSYFIFSRNDIETTILRTPGTMCQETADDMISNLYSYKIVNKTFAAILVQLQTNFDGARIRMVGGDIVIPKQEVGEGAFFIDIPKSRMFTDNVFLTVTVSDNGRELEQVKTRFIGPGSRVKH